MAKSSCATIRPVTRSIRLSSSADRATPPHLGNVGGLQWFTNDLAGNGLFPQYYKHVGNERVAVAASDVPAELGLLDQKFKLAEPGIALHLRQPDTPWRRSHPARQGRSAHSTAQLVDGCRGHLRPRREWLVPAILQTRSWYRFVDQPSFQQYRWSAEKRAKLQAFVEKLHAHWPMDRDYMPPPTRGTLVALDPALLVVPPKGLEVGYVPIVTHQAAR